MFNKVDTGLGEDYGCDVCSTWERVSNRAMQYKTKELAISERHFEAKVRSLVVDFYNTSNHCCGDYDCSSKSIAVKMKMAQRTFQREIRRITGRSFKQLHLLIRLELACILFGKGYNVTQVADRLSFSSPAHLSSSFKKQFGVTPSMYRQTMVGAE